MNNHQITELLKISMASIKEIADVDMIVGSSMELGSAVVIPISKVKYSFISGGLDQQAPKPYVDGDYPFGGGAGGMTSITPVAFLVYVNNDVKLLHLEEASHSLETLVDAVPNAVTKIINAINNKADITCIIQTSVSTFYSPLC